MFASIWAILGSPRNLHFSLSLSRVKREAGFERELVHHLHFRPFIHFGSSITTSPYRSIFDQHQRVYNSGGRDRRFLEGEPRQRFKQQYFVYWCRVSVSRVNVLISKKRSAPDVNISNSSWSAHSSYHIPPVFLFSQNLQDIPKGLTDEA